MKLIKTVKELKTILGGHRSKNEQIGLVPTMGALHKGHLSLVERSVKENQVTVVSVFVNPTQFNDKGDLDRYPRTLEQDQALLKAAGCTYVFAPSVEEIYPEEDERVFDFSPLDQVMEGPARPGHFNGVGQIVSKLFYFTEPDKAYFGEKDFQQVAIICLMVKQLNLKVEIVSCPIQREPSGLAMSSRNVLLSKEEKEIAAKIYKTLSESQQTFETDTVAATKTVVSEELAKEPLFKLEYFEIVDGHTLQPVLSKEESDFIVGCITLYCGKIRLIDNIVYKK